MDPQCSQLFRQRLLVCDQHSTVAETAQVLAWEKTNAADFCNACGPPAFVFRSNRLSRIFNDLAAVLMAKQPYLWPSSITASISAHPPYRWTGMIAFTRVSLANVRANESISMLNVAGSMSTKTGTALARFFQLLDVLSQNETLRIQHLRHLSEYFSPDLGVLRLQIQQWNLPD
jgi:hypothetical protein